MDRHSSALSLAGLLLGLTLSPAARSDGFRVVELAWSTGERAVVTLVESLGGLHVSESDLPLKGLRPEALAGLSVATLPGCARCYRLSDLGLYEEDVRTASARLDWHPVLLRPRIISAEPSIPVAPLQVEPSLALSYVVRGLHLAPEQGVASTSGAIEPRLSLGLGRYGSLTSTGVVSSDLSQRGDTVWRHYDVEAQRRLGIGDIISQAGTIGSAVRLGGIQLARDFSLNENFLNRPVYTLGGQTALPATLEVFVDGQRRFSEQLAAGQYQVRDLDVSTSGSDVDLVLTNVLGEREIIRSRLFGNAFRLPAGASDYAIEMGTPRRLADRYQGLFGAATWRYGFQPWLAGEIHGEGGDGGHVLGSAALSLATSWGRVLLGGGVASQQDGTQAGRRMGTQGRLSWAVSERLSPTMALGLNLDASVSDEFRRYGSTQDAPSVYRGSLQLSWRGLSLRSGYTDAGGIRSLQGDVLIARPPFLFSTGVQQFLDGGALVMNATLSWQPLQPEALPNVDLRRVVSDRLATDTLRIGDYLPASRTAYAFSGSRQQLSENRVSDQGSVNLNQTFDVVQASYLYQLNRDSQLHSLALAGGVAFHGGSPFLTSYQGERQGHVAVQTEVPGVRVRQGLFEATTDASGVAVFTVPAFTSTLLSLDVSSLPSGYHAGSVLRQVRVSADSRAIVNLPVDRPGFWLRIPGFTGDEIIFNGRRSRYTRQGAWVVSGQEGINTLSWGKESRQVRLHALRTDAPTYILSDDGYLMRLLPGGAP